MIIAKPRDRLWIITYVNLGGHNAWAVKGTHSKKMKHFYAWLKTQVITEEYFTNSCWHIFKFVDILNDTYMEFRYGEYIQWID